MASSIPDSIIEDVRAASDIVEVISDYVLLKKKGKNYLGLCPFHHEKTPSFTVTPDRQMFYCFGCNVGGNVFTFLMKRENWPFVEAVRYLADKAGIALPEEGRDQGQQDQLEKAFRLNEVAKNFYYHVFTSSDLSRQAREYLARRGLTEATIDKFQLGFAPNAWDGLKNYVTRKGVSEKAMARLGLVLPRSGREGYYDRFRNRLMFPIFDLRGRTIGFGGRVLDDSLPKYLNSPETELFDKGKNLYGLNLALPAIREQGFAIVVEGYMDVITAHQNGLSNVVASLGTALTRDQGKLLQRYTDRVTLAYDTDEAGQTAAARGGEVLLDLGFRVDVAEVPAGKDPDEFIRAQGGDAFREQVVQKAKPLVDYLFDKALAKIDGGKIEGKVRLANEIIPYIARINSTIEIEEYIKKISARLGVTASALQEELRRHQGKSWNKRDKNAKKSYTSTMSAYPGGGQQATARRKAEYLLARYMLESKDYFSEISTLLGIDFYEDHFLKKLIEIAQEMNVPGSSLQAAAIFNRLNEEDALRLSQLLTLELPEGNINETITGCIETIRGHQAKTRREEILAALRKAEDDGDENSRKLLLEEYQKLF